MSQHHGKLEADQELDSTNESTSLDALLKGARNGRGELYAKAATAHAQSIKDPLLRQSAEVMLIAGKADVMQAPRELQSLLQDFREYLEPRIQYIRNALMGVMLRWSMRMPIPVDKMTARIIALVEDMGNFALVIMKQRTANVMQTLQKRRIDESQFRSAMMNIHIAILQKIHPLVSSSEPFDPEHDVGLADAWQKKGGADSFDSATV